MNETNGKMSCLSIPIPTKIHTVLAAKMSSTRGLLDEIEDAMSNLESTIMSLDAYSRSLESQVKKFEKTSVANRATSPNKDA